MIVYQILRGRLTAEYFTVHNQRLESLGVWTAPNNLTDSQRTQVFWNRARMMEEAELERA